MSIVEESFGTTELICAFFQSYCVKFACDHNEARD